MLVQLLTRALLGSCLRCGPHMFKATEPALAWVRPAPPGGTSRRRRSTCHSRLGPVVAQAGGQLLAAYVGQKGAALAKKLTERGGGAVGAVTELGGEVRLAWWCRRERER